ncbi:hypothetical protein FAF44_00460 [Nonomuraea sp. MG754425]|uniref:hypothetical protein n=1 Tax=Nonomuraea sp. MG754425 TaxID=2570319 RepID=UPI001F2B7196|nr:hypothetical protein [Nonomuraea sp. MG754425]MCF6466888.1 hypothetical protein [Nonomuraea sp. MG754425]
MIVLGLLLVLLAGGAFALVLTEESARYILFGYTFELGHVQMFLAGAAAAAVLLAGVWLLGSGSRRAARQRRRLRAARAETSNRMARLEGEKRDLERKLEREHTAVPGDRLVAGAEDPR